jgi:aspartyl-tRNA(Asn)/glutamyl-tRNA(Gln) amidotransferase subunit A
MMTITEAADALKAGKITAVALAEECLKNIKEKNPSLNAYLEVFDDVLVQAKAADEQIKTGTSGPLTGIPLAIKDNILIKGRVASSASKILASYQASYDATVIAKLKAAGAIFVGRTNMDEFAMGGSTENSAFGPTRNPHDTSRVAGGSSGGSAAAVAAGMALGALGSDTGGSIRQPASFCGVVGLKPTYGTVSRSGVMAMASSLDQIGPFAHTIEDTEVLYEAIKGQDPLDATSVPGQKVEAKKTYTIGVPEHFLTAGVNAEVLVNFRESLKKLAAAGHTIQEISLPNIKYSLACYYIIMPAESSTNLARFDGMRYGLQVAGDNLLEDYVKTRGAGFGPEVRRRILLGTYVLSAGYYDAYYGRAKAVQRLLKQDYFNAFKTVDLIATPTAPTTAFKVGEKTADPLQMYLEDIFTVPANLTGLPALSVPSGKDSQGLPFGLQLMAPHFHEAWLFDAGRSI